MRRDLIDELEGGPNSYCFSMNLGPNAIDPFGLVGKKPSELYCEAASQFPSNRWLQCACKVSGQINMLKYSLALGVQVGDTSAQRRAAKAKALWFKCMNNCMSKHWQVAHKKWLGDKLTPTEEKLLIPEWDNFCKSCSGVSAVGSQDCCEQQVRAEQRGFDKCKEECGTYRSLYWGTPGGTTTPIVMPNWPSGKDFNDYDARVAYGIGLCCPAATSQSVASQPKQ